jgi:hypothetical protein
MGRNDPNHPLYSPLPEFDEEGLMTPFWLKYPNIRFRSIGWRMGSGEEYFHRFVGWLENQSGEVRQRVRARYPGEGEWAGVWERLLSNRGPGGTGDGP